MPSASKQTNSVRQRKQRRRGHWRKNRLENEGTTLSHDELFRVQTKK